MGKSEPWIVIMRYVVPYKLKDDSDHQGSEKEIEDTCNKKFSSFIFRMFWEPSKETQYFYTRNNEGGKVVVSQEVIIKPLGYIVAVTWLLLRINTRPRDENPTGN